MALIEFIHKAQAGDDTAFLTIFQEYEIDIYRMAFLYVKNKDDALDVVRETSYRAFKNIQSLKQPQYIKTWLIKIAISCATDLLRKKKNVVYLDRDFTDIIESKEIDIPLSITLKDLLETLNKEIWQAIVKKGYKVKSISGGDHGTILYIFIEASADVVKKAQGDISKTANNILKERDYDTKKVVVQRYTEPKESKKVQEYRKIFNGYMASADELRGKTSKKQSMSF